MTMTGVVKPVGGGGKKDGKAQPASIKEFNKRLGQEIRRKKGLPPDYERGKDAR